MDLLNVGCSLSMLGLFITFTTYSLFSELRTLPGLNLMTLTIILFINNLLLLTGVRETQNQLACTTVAIMVHFFNLSGFFWMNIMTFDLYKTFGRKQRLKHALKNKMAPFRQYVRYSVYAWGCPAVIVFVCLIINFCDCSPFKIGYGEHFSCTISYPLAFLVMIGVPLAFTMSANIAMFVRTVCVLHKSREARELARNATNQNSQSDIKLAMKMSTVMGFSWFFSAIAVFLNGAGLSGTIVWYIFIIFNSLQGTFLSVTFVFNKRVYGLYEKRFCRKRVRARARAQTLRNHSVLTSTNTSSSGSSVLSQISSTTAMVDSRLSSVLDQVDEGLFVTQEVESETSEAAQNSEQADEDSNDDVFVPDVADTVTVTVTGADVSSEIKPMKIRDADSISQASDATASSHSSDTSEVTKC